MMLTTCVIGTPPIIFVVVVFGFIVGAFAFLFVSLVSAFRQFKPVGGLSGHVVGRDQLRHFPSDVLLRLFPHDACQTMKVRFTCQLAASAIHCDWLTGSIVQVSPPCFCQWPTH